MQISTLDIGDIAYDQEIEQYVGISLDEHEVYAGTYRECFRKLREINRVIIEHHERNRFEPDWEALGREPLGSGMADSRDGAEGPGIQ